MSEFRVETEQLAAAAPVIGAAAVLARSAQQGVAAAAGAGDDQLLELTLSTIRRAQIEAPD